MNKLTLVTIGLSFIFSTSTIAKTSLDAGVIPPANIANASGTIAFSGEVMTTTCSMNLEVNNKKESVIKLGNMKTNENSTSPVIFSLIPNQNCSEFFNKLPTTISWNGPFGQNGLNNTDKGQGGAKNVYIKFVYKPTKSQDIVLDATNLIKKYIPTNKNSDNKGYVFSANLQKVKGKIVTPGLVTSNATYTITYN